MSKRFHFLFTSSPSESSRVLHSFELLLFFSSYLSAPKRSFQLVVGGTKVQVGLTSLIAPRIVFIKSCASKTRWWVCAGRRSGPTRWRWSGGVLCVPSPPSSLCNVVGVGCKPKLLSTVRRLQQAVIEVSSRAPAFWPSRFG